MSAVKIAFVVMSGFLLSSCGEAPRAAPKYSAGQMVRMTAFGSEAMVVAVYCPAQPGICQYDLRFAALQMHTSTRLFSPDGPITLAPVARVNGIREFEIEALR